MAHGLLAGHILNILVWLELEMTQSFTRKQMQTESDTKDRAALEHEALPGQPFRSHANVSELWVPSDFQGSLFWPLITGLLPHTAPLSLSESLVK